MKKTYITPDTTVVALDGEALMNLVIGSNGTNSASEGLSNRKDQDDTDWEEWEEEEF